MTLRSGGVNTSTVGGLDAFVSASLATQQSSNIGANDHVKFDTVNVFFGNEVSLDVTSTYSNSAATASIGRLTLHGTANGGLTYVLRFQPGYILFSGATGSIDFAFFDATKNAQIPGGTCSVRAATDAGNDGASGGMEVVFEPTQDTLVEVRITAVTALTRIGTTGSLSPSLFAQTL